ncbi:MAG: dienelactone hydrolase family protein, partial [Aestuariibacter sp.]|nr:dienelactone hydrolase family protein [Aestuariibacter sp.]
MCDEKTERDAAHYAKKHNTMDRRQFNTLVALGTLGAVLPQFAVANTSLSRQQVMVDTPDGTA